MNENYLRLNCVWFRYFFLFTTISDPGRKFKKKQMLGKNGRMGYIVRSLLNIAIIKDKLSYLMTLRSPSII
jgi:hypothetical protein